ncbi:MAG: host attachment protein [Candidatus Magasanikbacteria bacterium]|nr:host attachment protein [Candidatus Magasanikbacteria bacterium]
MKIPSQLPQFTKETVLLIVTGLQEAEFFLAGEGKLDRVGGFRVEKPQYSDREDFSRGGGALVFESGAKFEARKRLIWQDFRRQFKEQLANLVRAHDFTAVYLLAPAPISATVKALLPAALQKKIKRTVRGNFFKEHPLKILARLSVQ